MRFQRRYIRSLVLLFLVLTFGQRPSFAQGSAEQLIVTDIDASQFPQVSLAFRALDANGSAVSGLLPADLSLSENNEAVSIDSLEETEGGLWVHFVIDAGVSMRDGHWTNAQEAILGFLRTVPWMKDGLDHVAISAVEATGLRTLADYTSSSSQLASALERYSPPGGSAYSAPLSPITDLIEQLDLNTEAKNQAKYVVLVTPGLESVVGYNTLVQRSQALGIPLYTVLVRGAERIPCPPPVTDSEGNVTRAVCDENIRDLAQATGGIYTHYADRNSLNDTFERLTAERRQYRLSYRSHLGDSGTRQVSLTAGGATTAETASYTVEVNPIRVLIDSPRQGESILRQAAAFTEDRGSIPPTSYTVVASAVFPDARRRILQAELLVNGSVTSQIDFPGETIELPWNLRDITELGVNDQVLQVRIRDELGLESVSQPSTVKVEVIVPAREGLLSGVFGTGEQGAPSVVTETVTVFATPTPIVCVLPDAVCPAERAVRGNPLASASMVLALFSLGFAGVVWVNRDKEIVRTTTARITKAVENLTRKRGGKARAYLEILAGEANVGRVLPIFGTTRIGRSKQDADLLFQQNDDNPVVSRIHCTITDMESHFTITDSDSTQGTYLNGSRLEPLIPEQLEDRDEIELGLVEVGGVRLRFSLAGETHDEETSRVTEKTRGGTATSNGSQTQGKTF